MKAQFIGVGVGPGDPELMTLKSARYIQQADVISYIANKKGQSQAKDIAHNILKSLSEYDEIPLCMPMSEDRALANAVYDEAAIKIGAAIDEGKNVVFLCEGDPLFFGSFAYLLERLKPLFCCEVVPGISSVHAASSVLQIPLTMQKESFSVVSGRHSTEKLELTLKQNDSVVIMKAGRSRQKILASLSATGRTREAKYLEYIGRGDEKIHTDVSALSDEPGPYFSLFVVTKKQRDQC